MRPDTERVRAGALRVGDVVMEDLDHPVIITTLSIPAKGNVTIHGNYIWQHPNERSWFLGSFRRLHMFDKAIPGEY